MADLDVDSVISDFARFHILTSLYEGPIHSYGILRKFQSRVEKRSAPASSTHSSSVSKIRAWHTRTSRW